MFELSGRFVEARSLWVAAKLQLADMLANGARSAEDLAREANVHPHALQRLLRVVASLGLMEEVEVGRFALTRLGQLLRRDVPNSMHAWVLMTGLSIYKSFEEMLYSVQTGKPAAERVHGKPMYQYFRERPEEAKAFNDAMVCYGGQSAGALEDYDFSWARSVCDVGAGPGTVILSLLKAHPHLKGVLFDLPNVAALAREHVAGAGLDARCEIVGGDFFQQVPGADVVIISSVIHNWMDAEALTILRNCRKTIHGRGRLLLLEMVIPSDNKPHFSKQTDLVMLVSAGGTERTEAEYAALLAQAGFRLTRVIPTRYLTSIIEAEPVE
jgi:2-polyprenyl-3-methyl-5-hydroxy-6-metoxy-1,4-benzoquinol methylase